MDLALLAALAVWLLAVGPMVLAGLEQASGADVTPRARTDGQTPPAGVKRFQLGLVVGALAIATWVSSRSHPAKLPGFAMDSSLLFHIERGAFALALVATAIMVGYRAVIGEFPLKLGPFEWPDKKATEAMRTETELELLRIETNLKEAQTASQLALDDALAAIASKQLDPLKQRVDKLEGNHTPGSSTKTDDA